MNFLLFFTLIRFAWLAAPGPAPVDSYKLCIGTSPGACTVTATAPGTSADVDLDINQVWYAQVKAVNQYGESLGSNQVVVGFPQAPTGLSGKLSAP